MYDAKLMLLTLTDQILLNPVVLAIASFLCGLSFEEQYMSTYPASEFCSSKSET